MLGPKRGGGLPPALLPLKMVREEYVRVVENDKEACGLDFESFCLLFMVNYKPHGPA